MTEPVETKESLLPRLSVRRPISVLMIFCALLLVGAIAYIKLPITLFPSGFDPPFLWVWVSYRTSNPTEIEEQITRPLEQPFDDERWADEIRSGATPPPPPWTISYRQTMTERGLQRSSEREKSSRELR